MTDLLRNYLNHLRIERGLSPNSIIAASSDLTQFTNFIGESRFESKEFDSSDARRFLVDVSSRGASASTVNRKRNSLSGIFRFCGKPMMDVERAKQWDTLPEIISEAEAQKMIEHARTPFERSVIALLYCCGLRASELFSVMVNTDNTSLRVFGKGSKERIVPCPAWLVQLLDIKALRGLSRYQIYRIVIENAKRSINKPVYPHMLRHSCATHMMQGGADLRIIQEFLGHDSLETTQIYTRVDINHLREVIAEFHPRSFYEPRERKP